MAQLVLNIIDSYHDIMDNKSGEYFYYFEYHVFLIFYYYLMVSTFDCDVTSKTLILKK